MTDEEKKVISLASARDKDKEKKSEKPSEKAPKKEAKEVLHCSFCGRPNHLVVKMIKGPNVNICSECIMICVQYFILDDKMASSDAQKVLDSFWQGVKK